MHSCWNSHSAGSHLFILTGKTKIPVIIHNHSMSVKRLCELGTAQDGALSAARTGQPPDACLQNSWQCMRPHTFCSSRLSTGKDCGKALWYLLGEQSVGLERPGDTHVGVRGRCRLCRDGHVTVRQGSQQRLHTESQGPRQQAHGEYTAMIRCSPAHTGTIPRPLRLRVPDDEPPPQH
ncbi:MAG: hypothetical protein MZV63_70585 [Marinilabiliales bacterium]|nr:hypothetical protein [Marinilabiliales bacterium]